MAFSVSYWFFSVNRAILLWFPLWMMIGSLVEWRPERPAARVAHRIVVGLGFAASAAAHAGLELAVLHRQLGQLIVSG